MGMLRPKSIRWFDRLYLTAIALGMIFSAMSASEIFELSAMHPENNGYFMTTLFAPVVYRLVIGMPLWFFIARRASNAAKWIWISMLALVVIGSPIALLATAVHPEILLHAGFESMFFIITIPLLYIIAASMLFRPDAKAWFAAKGKPVDPSTFD